MSMNNFSKEIFEFQKTGVYNYQFDEGGNLVFNTNSPDFNEHFVSIPIKNWGYNNNKINSFYDINFNEFIPTTNVVTSSVTISSEVFQLTTENQQLKDKLITLTELSDANMTDSERLAVKQVIINLRIQLKQGVAERDFSETFPYLPITKNN